MGDSRPIGVFDSGLGGLTVLRALTERLPDEATVYLGDTARVPYGTRSAEAVIRYAQNNARTLLEAADIKLLVIACNTASAVALDALADLPVPVVGVIYPGAEAAVRATTEGTVLVLGTAGTVRSGAYQRALGAAGHKGKVEARACPLFVPLVEEGWTSGSVPEQVAARYLAEPPEELAAVVLGCTHYPLLADVVRGALPGDVDVVDGGRATAEEVARLLAEHRLAAPSSPDDGPAATGRRPARHRMLVTDAPEQMAALGPRFLGRELDAEPELIDVILTDAPAGGALPKAKPSSPAAERAASEAETA